MTKDFTFRAMNEEYRMLAAILGAGYGGTWRASKAINNAIDATPEKWLQRKPVLLHVQLSDSAVRKLNKVAKKHKLSDATLIERALDWQYRKTALKLVKNIAAKADAVIDKKGTPIAVEMDLDMLQLLNALLPFAPFDFSINRGEKPYMVVKEGWRTPYEPDDVAAKQ
ncbi:MAG: hypothetical protein JRN34_00905 [Nitrososphaerota archaeon]|nr:hypothetical protein [Nitrososphaerota archaeon]MDG6941472.1 hypothetical protein [Nitrososphaerota archaeon]